MAKEKSKNQPIILEKVRIIFPNLFEKEDNKKFPKPEDKRKYTARFLLSKTDPKHIEIIDKIKSTIKLYLKENKIIDDTSAYKFFIDGDVQTQFDEDNKLSYLKGHYSLKASNFKQPHITGKDQQALTIEDKEMIYGGCFVHAYIELYAYSQGVAAALHHVQFSKKGNLIGREPINASDMFAKFDIEEDEEDEVEFGSFTKKDEINEDLF